MFFYLNKDKVIKAVSETQIKVTGGEVLETSQLDHLDRRFLVGKKIHLGPEKPPKEYRVAFIGNWGDYCGIATYADALVSSLRPLVQEVRIFAEHTLSDTSNDEADNVVRCWRRGENMSAMIEQVLAWKPDVVHVQHEFGLFPKATYFLKMLEALDGIPYVITLHSVYEHLDKTICTAYIKNIIVHSNNAKMVLEGLGHSSNVIVMPHGCVVYEDPAELWNIFQTDYAVVQFGFGFSYKGVDLAIEAIRILKERDPKFKDIFYCYLCSENPHTRSAHEDYYSYLKGKIAAADLSDHVAVLRGFLSDQLIRNFLRTAKLAIFPYQTDPNNCVYGASGAVRHAMANGVPVVASNSHLFDDLDGVLPRAVDAASLAGEMDRIFSSYEYKKSLVEKNLAFLKGNDWRTTAGRHVDAYKSIVDAFMSDRIIVTEYELR